MPFLTNPMVYETRAGVMKLQLHQCVSSSSAPEKYRYRYTVLRAKSYWFRLATRRVVRYTCLLERPKTEGGRCRGISWYEYI